MITILATTWMPPEHEKIRLDTFMKCLISWKHFLQYYQQINLHISDDGSSGGWADLLYRQATSIWDRGDVSFSTQDRRGLGASLNAGLEQAFKVSDLVFHAVDDWLLLQEMDLNNWTEFMQDQNFKAEMVRFFAHPDLTGTFKHIPPYGWAVLLDKHHYFFSFRPLIWHKSLFDRVGYFKEGVSALECEDDFNTRLKDADVNVWLGLPELWRHEDPISLSGVSP